MTSWGPAWVGLCKTWPGRGTRICIGSDVWLYSSPGRRETSGIGAPSPSVYLGCLGRSADESPKVGRGAKGRTPIICGWDSGGFADECDIEAQALFTPATLAS